MARDRYDWDEEDYGNGRWRGRDYDEGRYAAPREYGRTRDTGYYSEYDEGLARGRAYDERERYDDMRGGYRTDYSTGAVGRYGERADYERGREYARGRGERRASLVPGGVHRMDGHLHRGSPAFLEHHRRPA